MDELTRRLDQLRIQPNDPQLLCVIGRLLCNGKDWLLAQKYLKRAYALCPQNLEILNQYARVLEHQLQWEQARDLYAVSFVQNPNNEIAEKWSTLQYLLGEYEAAGRVPQ